MRFLRKQVIILLLMLTAIGNAFSAEDPGIVVYYSAHNSYQKSLAEAINKMVQQLRALGPLRWQETVISGNGRPAESVPVYEEV